MRSSRPLLGESASSLCVSRVLCIVAGYEPVSDEAVADCSSLKLLRGSGRLPRQYQQWLLSRVILKKPSQIVRNEYVDVVHWSWRKLLGLQMGEEKIESRNDTAKVYAGIRVLEISQLLYGHLQDAIRV